jgi:RNA 2',3'-cyclic 3'-phosphodiesterase
MPRMFVAVDIPPKIREQIGNMCHGVDRAHWVPLSQVHLTLEFLGELNTNEAELIADELSEIRAEPFTLSLQSVGFFPPRKLARILWVGVSASPALLSLQRQVRSIARDLGIEVEERKYAPHITLARFRQPAEHVAIAPFIAAHSMYRSDTFTVSEFCLYSSELGRDGATHTLEQTYPLE